MNEVTVIENKIKAWLAKPNQMNALRALDECERLGKELKEALRSMPTAGRQLGPLTGELHRAQRHLIQAKDIEWVPLGSGHLAIGHRPGTELLQGIRVVGGTHILTLLSENEGAPAVGRDAERCNLSWLWFPMKSAQPPTEDQAVELQAMFVTAAEALKGGAGIYLHCSAGIHRTGMIAYAFLRYLGCDASEAWSKLANLRSVTQSQVGEHRIAWADGFGEAFALSNAVTTGVIAE